MYYSLNDGAMEVEAGKLVPYLKSLAQDLAFDDHSCPTIKKVEIIIDEPDFYSCVEMNDQQVKIHDAKLNKWYYEALSDKHPANSNYWRD